MSPLSLRHLSPSVRLGLLGVLVLSSASTTLSQPVGLAALAASAVVALLATPRASGLFFRRALPLVSFALFGVLLALLAPVSGDEAAVRLPVWPRPASAPALGLVASLWVKSALILAWVTVFAKGFRERDLLEAFLGLPLPPRMAALCYLVVRSLANVSDETTRLVRARDSRGRPRGLRALRVAAAMAQVLIVRLGRRAETVALALAARGYDGTLRLLDVRPMRPLQAGFLLMLGGFLVWVARL